MVYINISKLKWTCSVFLSIRLEKCHIILSALYLCFWPLHSFLLFKFKKRKRKKIIKRLKTWVLFFPWLVFPIGFTFKIFNEVRLVNILARYELRLNSIKDILEIFSSFIYFFFLFFVPCLRVVLFLSISSNAFYFLFI